MRLSARAAAQRAQKQLALVSCAITAQGFVQQLVDPASLGKQGVALFTAPPKQVSRRNPPLHGLMWWAGPLA